jgi:two-component system response regulator RegX3
VLVARARALLRRARMTEGTLNGASAGNYADAAGPVRRVLAFGDFSLDLDACLLRKAGERIPLSAREFDVLGFLVENAGKAFSPQEIYDRVWGQRYGDPTTIGVYVQRIRRKIELDPKEPRLIETVKGKGYRFESDALVKGR